MGADPFLRDRVTISVAVDPDYYAQLRGILFRRGVSVNAVFAEFIKGLVDDRMGAFKFVDEAVNRKAKAKLEKHMDIEFKPRKIKKFEPTINNDDRDTIYAMIAATKDEDS